MRFALSCLACIAICFDAASGLASAPCSSDAHRIEIAVSGEPASLGTAVFAELSSELERRRLCTVADAGGVAPLARIEIQLEEPSSARVHIVDTVTQKTVERRVQTRGLAPDEQALPIAIAADELLRASWAELTLRRPARAAVVVETVPKVVRDAVLPESSEAPFERQHELGVEAAVAGYSGGLVGFGANVGYQYDVLPWLAGRVFAFAREGLPVEAPHGTLRTHVVGGGLTLAFYPLRVGAFRLGPSAGIELMYAAFEGRPVEGARGDGVGVLGVSGTLGGRATVELLPVRVIVGADFLVPFRAVEAADGETPIAGATGVGAGGAVGLAVPF